MTYVFVSGSPSAAENPPRDRVWRAMVRDAVAVARRGSPTRLGLHFVLEPSRTRIDLDNLVRLAVAGIQDGGAIPRPTSGVDEYVATKQSVLARPGLLVTFDSTPVTVTDHDDDVELRVASAELPREGATDSKRRWRGHMEAAWQWPPTEHPVALDIEARTRYSLVAHLKPI